jgi:hypothetical protein
MDKENVVSTHSGVLFSHKNEERNYVFGRKIELKTIMLSEISQAEKAKYHMFLLYENFRLKRMMGKRDFWGDQWAEAEKQEGLGLYEVA